MSGPGGDLDRWWRLGVGALRPIVGLCFRLRVVGIEAIPDGPGILAANHLSALDGPILAIATAARRRRRVRFLVAAEFFSSRWVGWILRGYRQIPIRRGQRDAAALDEAIGTVRGGALAGIFPEGTVNPDPTELARLHRGAARIALGAGAPLVPVGIWGTHRRWPRAGLTWGRPLRTRVTIAFGPPLAAVAGTDPPEDIEGLTARLADAIASQVERARGIDRSG